MSYIMLCGRTLDRLKATTSSALILEVFTKRPENPFESQISGFLGQKSVGCIGFANAIYSFIERSRQAASAGTFERGNTIFDLFVYFFHH